MKAKPRDKPIEILPDGRKVMGKNAAGEPICNSLLRNKPGRRCGVKIALFQNGRCERHGGSSPHGIASQTFVNGKTSKYRDVLHPRYLTDFDRLVADPDFTSLREDISLARLALRDAISAATELDPDSIKVLFREAKEAKELLAGEYDEIDLETTIKALLAAVDALEERCRAQTRISGSQEHLRRLVDTENKREVAQQTMIPAAKAMFLFRYMVESIRTAAILQEEFIERYYPNVLEDKRLPNIRRLVMRDIEPLIPTRSLTDGTETEPGD